MVYTFVRQENPVFCFISREKISPICLEPETKFSREFQHKSYLNPKLVIVTQTNSMEFYLYIFISFRKKGFIFGLSYEILIFSWQLKDINFLVLSIQFQLIVNIIFQSKELNIVVWHLSKAVIIMQEKKCAKYTIVDNFQTGKSYQLWYHRYI